MYACTSLSGTVCTAWTPLTSALSLSDIEQLLPAVLLCLVVAFGFRLVRRVLHR